MTTEYDYESCTVCTRREELINMHILCTGCGPALLKEITELKRQQEIWRRVCEFERKKWEQLVKAGMITPTSDFGSYLKAVEELAPKPKSYIERQRELAGDE